MEKLRHLFSVPPIATDADDRSREYDEMVAVDNARAESTRRLDNLQRATDCCVSDAVRDLLISGKGLRETPALVFARTWLADQKRRPWLAIAGDTGIGKSVACAHVVAERGAVWFRAERLQRVWNASFGDQYDEQETARCCGMLILDDVGSEPDAAKMQTTLLELLDSRKARARSTVMTTNLSTSAFKTRYPNPRLHSLMHELVKWESGNGPDMRRGK